MTLRTGSAGKAVEQPAVRPALAQQEFRVVLEARDEAVDVIAELGVAAIDMRQVRIGVGRHPSFSPAASRRS